MKVLSAGGIIDPHQTARGLAGSHELTIPLDLNSFDIFNVPKPAAQMTEATARSRQQTRKGTGRGDRSSCCDGLRAQPGRVPEGFADHLGRVVRHERDSLGGSRMNVGCLQVPPGWKFTWAQRNDN
jgi:hypothetical protein